MRSSWKQSLKISNLKNRLRAINTGSKDHPHNSMEMYELQEDGHPEDEVATPSDFEIISRNAKRPPRLLRQIKQAQSREII